MRTISEYYPSTHVEQLKNLRISGDLARLKMDGSKMQVPNVTATCLWYNLVALMLLLLSPPPPPPPPPLPPSYFLLGDTKIYENQCICEQTKIRKYQCE